MKDIDLGIEMMMEADTYLYGNFDLKIKIAQILYQEKQDTKNGMFYVQEALTIKPTDPEALILKGKMHIREKEGE